MTQDNQEQKEPTLEELHNQMLERARNRPPRPQSKSPITDSVIEEVCFQRHGMGR